MVRRRAVATAARPTPLSVVELRLAIPVLDDPDVVGYVSVTVTDSATAPLAVFLVNYPATLLPQFSLVATRLVTAFHAGDRRCWIETAVAPASMLMTTIKIGDL
jgi:hypothetical protein